MIVGVLGFAATLSACSVGVYGSGGDGDGLELWLFTESTEPKATAELEEDLSNVVEITIESVDVIFVGDDAGDRDDGAASHYAVPANTVTHYEDLAPIFELTDNGTKLRLAAGPNRDSLRTIFRLRLPSVRVIDARFGADVEALNVSGAIDARVDDGSAVLVDGDISTASVEASRGSDVDISGVASAVKATARDGSAVLVDGDISTASVEATMGSDVDISGVASAVKATARDGSSVALSGDVDTAYLVACDGSDIDTDSLTATEWTVGSDISSDIDTGGDIDRAQDSVAVGC